MRLLLALCSLLPAQQAPRLGPFDIQRNGPSENRVDVIVMGDGYREDQQNQFDDIARHVPKLFEHDPTLGEYARYFNFAKVNLVSKDDGITGFGRKYETALGGHVTGDVKGHGQAGVDHGKVHAILAEVPQQDGLAIVFVNKGTLGTGGGGIAVIGGREDDTVIHEWGHAFAGLADEYIDMVHRGAGKDAPNVSGSSDPKTVRWAHWIALDAPGIGVYEGAAGMQRGAWKPTTGGCVMDHGRTYCRVCREAVVTTIYRYVDPIEAASPDPKDALSLSASRVFEVTVMRPASHALEVRWWLFPEKDAPAARGRGRLPEIKKKPTAVTSGGTKGVHPWRLVPREFDPGRYVLVCRVRDTTKVDGQDLPWVVKDEQGLLESERRWTVVLAR
jgi:hypothetical protein